MILVVEMKIYLDLVFVINFIFDLLLLMTVAIECKSFSSRIRLCLGALFGSFTTFILFLPFNNISIFLFKAIISVVMILIAFKYVNKIAFFKQIKSLYGSSIILAGIMYFIENQLNFFDNTINNFLIIIISGPIVFYLYIKKHKEHIIKKELVHQVAIKCRMKTIKTLGFIDTGNNIKDPYKKRSVIIIDSKELEIPIEDAILVPYKTVDSTNLLRCIEIEEILLDGKLVSNKYLLGISPLQISINGASCILPNTMESDISD